MRQAHRIELKNVKNTAINESINFVKQSSQRVTKLLSSNHKNIARQFLEFKQATYEKMDKMDSYHKDMVQAELALALRNPILEAEYYLNDEQPLNLYEGLLPQLRKYCRSRPSYVAEHKEMRAMLQREQDMTLMLSNQTLRTQNQKLQERNLYLEDQMKIVEWYNKVLADDIQGRDLLMKFEASQKQVVELTETVQQTKDLMESRVKKYKDKLKESQEKL